MKKRNRGMDNMTQNLKKPIHINCLDKELAQKF